jgi:hypothetical protein
MYYGWGPTKHEYPAPRSMKEAYGYDARLATNEVRKGSEIGYAVVCLIILFGLYSYMGVFQ